MSLQRYKFYGMYFDGCFIQKGPHLSVAQMWSFFIYSYAPCSATVTVYVLPVAGRNIVKSALSRGL